MMLSREVDGDRGDAGRCRSLTFYTQRSSVGIGPAARAIRPVAIIRSVGDHDILTSREVHGEVEVSPRSLNLRNIDPKL